MRGEVRYHLIFINQTHYIYGCCHRFQSWSIGFGSFVRSLFSFRSVSHLHTHETKLKKSKLQTHAEMRDLSPSCLILS